MDRFHCTAISKESSILYRKPIFNSARCSAMKSSSDCTEENNNSNSGARWTFSAASVCQCVCPHDKFRTTKLRTMKLGGYVHRTKISPEFECEGKRSKVKGQCHRGQKGQRVRHFVRESFSGARSSRGIFFRERSSAACK